MANSVVLVAIITIIGNITMFVLQRKAAKEDRKNGNLEQDIKEIKEAIRELRVNQEISDSGLRALLHDGLYQSCTTYLQNGQISTSELENIGQIYNSYHNMGGNGTGTRIYERVCQLPIVDGV